MTIWTGIIGVLANLIVATALTSLLRRLPRGRRCAERWRLLSAPAWRIAASDGDPQPMLFEIFRIDGGRFVWPDRNGPPAGRAATLRHRYRPVGWLLDRVQEPVDERHCPGHEEQQEQNGDDPQRHAPEDEPGDRQRDDQDPEVEKRSLRREVKRKHRSALR